MKNIIVLIALLVSSNIYASFSIPTICPDLTYVTASAPHLDHVTKGQQGYFVKSLGVAFIDQAGEAWYDITYPIMHVTDKQEALLHGRLNVANAYQRMSLYPHQNGNSYSCRYFGPEAIIVTTVYTHPN